MFSKYLRRQLEQFDLFFKSGYLFFEFEQTRINLLQFLKIKKKLKISKFMRIQRIIFQAISGSFRNLAEYFAVIIRVISAVKASSYSARTRSPHPQPAPAVEINPLIFRRNHSHIARTRSTHQQHASAPAPALASKLKYF